MIGLQTGRVVVVDDNPKEADPLLKAFSKIGIASTYYSGNVTELPDNPLKGVRLVALDLHLAGDGRGEAREILGPPLGVLQKLIAPENGPFVVLAWTKHTELIDLLKQSLPSVCPSANPAFIIPLEKDKVKDALSGELDVAKIADKLKEAAKQWSPLDILLLWEQLVHDSASETSGTLSGLAASDDVSVWKTNLNSVLSKLGKASSGKQPADAETFLRAILVTLNLVHLDRLEHSAKGVPTELTDSISVLLTLRDSSGPNVQKINRMLVLAQVKEGDRTVRPGNLYVKDGWHQDAESFPANYDQLIKEFFDNAGEIERLRGTSYPILVELTPECDFTQNKNKMGRLVAGLLIPVQPPPKFKNLGPYFYKIDPFSINESDHLGAAGDYFLVLSARFLFSVSLDRLANCQPRTRVRRQVLVDLQAWFASHAARPGMLTLKV